MFEGMETGKEDDHGKMIKGGDRVEFYQWKEPYTMTETEDGWGRTVKLCRHDQRDVPAREKTIQGTVTYSPASTGFIVEFDDYMLETGRKEQNLYMLGKSINYKKDRLIIISR